MCAPARVQTPPPYLKRSLSRFKTAAKRDPRPSTIGRIPMAQAVALPSRPPQGSLPRALLVPLQLVKLPMSLALRLPVSIARFAAVRVLDLTEDVVTLASGAQRRARASPWLHDHWTPAPTGAPPATDLPTVGTLPPEVDGAFLRIGPNPPRVPRSPTHLFDGDGAVAVFRVEGGVASFCFSHVDTEKLAAERAAGRGRVEAFGSMRGVYGIFHLLLNQARRAATGAKWAKGPANTALAVHGNKLLALHEASMPYGLRVACDGALETLGRVLFDGECAGPISAHPKVHPASGFLYSVSYDFGGRPGEKTAVHAVAPDGVATRTIRLDLDDRPTPMMHDSQVTGRWVVVMDLSLIFKPENLGTGADGGFPIVFDKSRKARFGLLPVGASDAADMVWCEHDEPLFIFHTAAAWDEGDDSVVLWASTMDSFNLALDSAADAPENQLSKFTINASTRTVTRERFPLPSWGYGSIPPTFDFPTVRPGLPTTRRRYTYLLGMEQSRSDETSPIPVGVGVVKFDMESGVEAGRLRFDSGAGAACGGEAVFVPREGSTAEDDGYLVTIVNGDGGDGGEGWSALAVFDARTMSDDPVALVRAPQRVPLGFHALHVPLAQLRGLSRTA